jgi:hypothetical protein
MTPERPPTQPVSELDDQQILDLLQELRSMTPAGRQEDDAVIASIAELELEVVRRNLDAPSVAEPIIPAVALMLFEAACIRRDIVAAGDAIHHMDAAGLWFAYQRTKEQQHVGARMYLLERIRYCVELSVFGEERARLRAGRLAQATFLSAEDYNAYLVQCIDALLTFSILDHNLPY